MVIVIHPFLYWDSVVFLHIISLRKWFDNRTKNETLLEMIQSLQTNNEQLADRINTIENQKLPEKINTIEKGNIILARH